MSKLKWGEYYQDVRTGQLVRYCPLHIGQQQIMDSKARFLFFISGKGAGKSSFAPIWLEKQIREKPLGKYIVCSDSYNRLEQGIFPEFKKHFQYNDLSGKWSQGKHQYTLSSGGIVYFRSMDDPESVNAIHASAIVVDEGLILPKRAWDILESRVVLQMGKILVTSTPYYGKRWGMEVIDRAKAGDVNYFVWQGGSATNPSITPAEIERQRMLAVVSGQMWKFEQDYLGQFSLPSGTIYPAMRTCVIDPQPLPAGRIFGGVDIGHGGAPSAAVVGVWDRNNTLWIFFLAYVKPTGGESSYHAFAKHLKTWHDRFYRATGRQVERWFCDSATDTWKALRRYRLSESDVMPSLNCRPAKKGGGSIEYGIDLVSARIAEGRLKLITGTCEDMLEESDSYRYDVDEDNPSSHSIRGANHALDALRYLIMSVDRKR